MPSTVISYFTYDAMKQVLQIKFVSGLIYHYLSVPQSIYNGMKAAFAKGLYFNQYIKGKFAYEQSEE